MHLLDIRKVLFVLNQALNLLVALEETKISVDFDDFVLLDQLYLVALVDKRMGCPTDCLVPTTWVHSAKDATAHGNAAYKSVVYCVKMTFSTLKLKKNKQFNLVDRFFYRFLVIAHF